jgi:predicted O-linked N-acetylglucosamine transferase (SPINDLY family)
LLRNLLSRLTFRDGAKGRAAHAAEASRAEAERLIALGAQAESSGNWHQACGHYRAAVQAAPGYAKAQLNLGIGLEGVGDAAGAVAAYEAALAIELENPYAGYNLGKLLHTRGEWMRAEALLQSALRHKPEFPEALVVLASVYEVQGKLEAAAARLKTALEQRPDWPGALHNYAQVLKQLGRLDEAQVVLTRNVEADPDNADACLGLAMMCLEKGENDKAEALFKRALGLNPELLEARVGLVAICKDRRDYRGAERHAREMIELKPDYAVAHYCLGDALWNRGDRAGALKAFEQALATNLKYLEARWAHAMACIPMIGESESAVLTARAALLRELIELRQWINTNDSSGGHEAVAMIQPFYLAYTDEDNRDLLRRHGELCATLMGSWLQATFPTMPERRARDRIEVGIVSAHVFDHSVWNAIIKGWLTHLDKRRFSLSLFHLGKHRDQETAFAQSLVSYYADGGKSVSEWVRSILERRPDVLIYAEVGMDPTTLRLASMRLAPVQAATWGHPETTGLPTMDYYLSADLLEPDGADAYYTESLVRLPGLGVYYTPFSVAGGDFDVRALGLDPDRPLLYSPGAPFKYSPRYDRVFVEIVKRVKDCQLILVTGRNADVTALLRTRMREVFSSAGLDFDRHVKFISWLDRAEFFGLLKRADVFLDTIGFSGFNTAIQAVECGLPIVTLKGRFMRGRLASGILDRMGLSDLVAESDKEYVEFAVKLAIDADYRKSVSTRMAHARTLLYEDMEPVRALEVFLQDAVSRTVVAPGL